MFSLDPSGERDSWEHRMKGVQYVVNRKGEPQAVLIDLKKNRRLWEDFQDLMVLQKRRREPRVSLEDVETKLRKAGKIR
jgi:hypothetical protein